MSRQILLSTLKAYFDSKGKFLTQDEYKEAEDAPYRYQVVKRSIGTWPRLKNLLGEITPVVEVVEVPAKVPEVKTKAPKSG